MVEILGVLLQENITIILPFGYNIDVSFGQYDKATRMGSCQLLVA